MVLSNVYSLIRQRIPIIQWLPNYNKNDAICDLIAGITVGLTLIPQSIAYADLAGLDPQYGLYSGWIGCLVYIVFGSVKQISLGPTALVSLLTFTYTHHLNADMAVFLCFMSGCVELLCGLLHLGFLVDFVSVPVISGFSSAAAITIAASQLKGLFGLKYNTEAFVDTMVAFVTHVKETHLWDLGMGVTCIITLLTLWKLKDLKFAGNENAERQKFVKWLTWFISTARNALIVLICSFLAYILYQRSWNPFRLTGNIKPGLPSIQPPPTSTVINGRKLGFLEMISELGSGIIVVPLISITNNIAISKAFSNGVRVDASQEMIALGMCNIIASFARSMPVAGTMSRSAVNNASGVRTTFGALYTSTMMLLALSLLTPYFYFIPHSSLAAVLICALFSMVDYESIKPMWISNRRDLVPTAVTFLACLALGVEKGVLVGITVDVLMLLYFNARPHISIKTVETDPAYLVVQPYGALLFPSVDYLRNTVVTTVKQGQPPAAVVLDCAHIAHSDFTAAQGVSSMIKDIKIHSVEVILLNAGDKLVKSLNGGCHQLRVANSYQHISQILSGETTREETGICLNNLNKDGYL